MLTLILVEFRKLKRSRILYVVIGTMALFYLCAAAQGIKSAYSAYVLVSETLTYATYLVVPALLSLLGSYMLSREYQDDTMKSNRIIPVDVSKMTYAKLIVCLLIGISMFLLLYVFSIISIMFIHVEQLTPDLLLSYFRIFVLQAIGCFAATLPIIVVMSMIKNGCWISIVFAEVYSFAGLIAASSKFRTIYPVTAVFGFSGANTTTMPEFITCCLSLVLSAIIAGVVIKFDKDMRNKQ